MNSEEIYDEAMFEFSKSNYDAAIAILSKLLEEENDHFEARLSLGMAYYRKKDFTRAIEEGHKAEQLKPDEPLVHTNLSLFYMKAGNLKTAEHHGLKSKIASWKGNMEADTSSGPEKPDSQLKMSTPTTGEYKTPTKFPDMPWKSSKKTSN